MQGALFYSISVQLHIKITMKNTNFSKLRMMPPMLLAGGLASLAKAELAKDAADVKVAAAGKGN
jgi:hypothetical protein